METTGISEVTTVMRVNKEVNGFRVSGTVEVYNDKKEIKSISVTISDPTDEANTGTMPMKSYNYTMNRSINGVTMVSNDEESRAEALAVGLEFENLMRNIIATSSITPLTVE